MATQPKKQQTYGSKSKPSQVPLIAGGVIVLALALGGWFLLKGKQTSDNFDQLIIEGKASLEKKVDNRPDHGRGHTPMGQAIPYPEDPPTSGVHWPEWTTPGFYSAAEPKEKLVHALEHGNVVIYYDQPSADVVSTLKGWAGKFSGQWDGVVVVPRQGLGQAITLTAWDKVLRLDTWEPAVAAAFVDAYRGRGPENPVR